MSADEYEAFTMTTKDICPLMVDVLNALVRSGVDIDCREGRIAVAALGTALLQELGMEPASEGTAQGLVVMANAFLNALEKKYGDQLNG